MTTPVPLLIDTDGGVDDAAALFWAATSPLVELLGVTAVHGNVGVTEAAANVCRVLEAAGADHVPVAVGAGEPLGPVPPLRAADFIHGSDGLGNADLAPPRRMPGPLTVEELLTSTLGARPGVVTMVTLGPLTNVARFVASKPELVVACGRLVSMGGVIAGPGNALPGAEANVAHDPVAAQVALTAGWHRPPLLVGLDVTHRATLTTSELSLLAQRRTPAASFLAEPLAFYSRSAGTFCTPGEFPCHDLLAVIAAVHPLVSGPVLPLAVQVAPGPAWAMTVADRRQPFFERAGTRAAQATLDGFAPCEIGTGVDVDRFRYHVRQLFGES